MNISSKLRRLGKTKSQLLQRKRQRLEQAMPRFYVVETNEQAERIKAEHAMQGITRWHPLIVVTNKEES